jgi:beta-mannosidase
LDNPLWRRTSWWIQWQDFLHERGREPGNLEEYVAWSQKRQADALAMAVGTCKRRFPQCGGVILWMGHDSFPCTANTSILDFHGSPKPAVNVVAKVFRGEPMRKKDTNALSPGSNPDADITIFEEWDKIDQKGT